MLDKVRWDKASNKINQIFKASGGDQNGRGMEVVVTNNNIVEDLTDFNLYLGWKTKNNEHSGFDIFEPIDASSGVFKIKYTTGMLSNSGHLQVALILISNESERIESLPFIIDVTQSVVTDETIQSEDSFTALTEALAQINRYQADIDGILNGLEAEYGAFTSGIQTQFNDAMANLTVDSELITARTSTATGDTFTTVGNRIDNAENMIILGNHKAYFEINNGYPRLRLEEI